MRKKLLATTLLSAFLLTLSPVPQALAADTVQVTLPSFSVTLNGQTTGNNYSKYPLLVYKDITYFPMTYYDCRLLGLKTDWTADTGLVIDKNEDYFYEYLREVNNSKNARKQTAKLADGKITVNGKVIDNSKEEYPLLVFRDVTYFPLTWRFAVSEFGWDYRFNQQEGLVIDNEKVKLENPEEEQWDITPYSEGHSGRGNQVQFAFFFDGGFTANGITVPLQQLQTSPSPLRLAISNMGDLDRFIDARIACHIYQQVDAHEELIYWYVLPPLNKKIEWAGYAYFNITPCLWTNPQLEPGVYKISLQTPNYFDCYRLGEDSPSQLILHGPDAEVEFLGENYPLYITNL